MAFYSPRFWIGFRRGWKVSRFSLLGEVCADSHFSHACILSMLIPSLLKRLLISRPNIKVMELTTSLRTAEAFEGKDNNYRK